MAWKVLERKINHSDNLNICTATLKFIVKQVHSLFQNLKRQQVGALVPIVNEHYMEKLIKYKTIIYFKNAVKEGEYGTGIKG